MFNLAAADVRLWSVLFLLVPGAFSLLSKRETCLVPASGTNATDDAPAILEAFKRCGKGGTIRFPADTTYYVNTVMNVTGLEDVDIDIGGTLLWSTDIQYWLNNSLDVGYQNQSTAFILGGNNVRIRGNGTGILNGNGEYWYDFIRRQPNTSNYPRRPHAITFNGLTNSQVEGLNFIRSQMWSMSIIYSHNVTLQGITVNNTGERGVSSNTDGANTIRSSNISFSDWIVDNGDDSISLKGNSTNVSITNCRFYNGLGIAIGSIGQYDGAYEVIQGVTVDNVWCKNTRHAFYFKTWTGTQVGYPPNGGGGGIADVSNMNVTNLIADGVRDPAIAISQCTAFSGGGTPKNCTNSEVEIHDISIKGLIGTSAARDVASLQCSAVKPCHDITIEGVDLRSSVNKTELTGYRCSQVKDTVGFSCTAPACEGKSGTGGCSSGKVSR